VKLENVLLELPIKTGDILAVTLSLAKLLPRQKQRTWFDHLGEYVAINPHNKTMLDEFDIPIFKKAYDLYLYVYGLRESVPKQDRYALWLRIEKMNLDVIEKILHASALYKAEKIEVLEKASVDLNMLRVFVRIAKDTKVLDTAKYAKIQQQIDEIGRMLGGWIKHFKGENESAPL